MWAWQFKTQCGAIKKTYNRVKDFKPKDRRYYLGLHLGAFFYKMLRTSDKGEKRKVNKIIHYIDPKIAALRSALIKEFKTELLELRKGKVTSLEEHRDEEN